MNKKVLLVLIILIPSIIYFLFELSEANFKKMAYYGPKTVDAKGDTIYYAIPDEALAFGTIKSQALQDSSGFNQVRFSFLADSILKNSKNAFIALFVKEGGEHFLGGLLEYEKYKREKLRRVTIAIIRNSFSYEGNKLKSPDLFKEDPSIHTYTAGADTIAFKKMQASYFVQKPAHVFNYFAVLVDKDHHIRGYYDPTYISEVKRMIEEYEHLVLKDEHAEMQKNNEIEKK